MRSASWRSSGVITGRCAFIPGFIVEPRLLRASCWGSIAAARAACNAEGLQFLDDTVGIASVKPARNTDGRLLLQRAYDFEFSDNGDNRIRGSVITLGRRVILLNVMAPRPAEASASNVIPLH